MRRNGSFYYTFDEDASILAILFNYKIINGRVGFPISAYNKVKNKLEEFSISYIVKEKKDIVMDFKSKNKYNRFLKGIKKKFKIIDKIKYIGDNIVNINVNEKVLDEIINLLEKNIDER